MRVAVVHGYFLHDSGSGRYVQELAQALVREGHEVTLVCQERHPERYDFIDEACDFDETNSSCSLEYELPHPRYPGRCRLVRPHLGGRLLVYVEGPFEGFRRSHVRAFQNAPREWIDAYLAANVAALRAAFAVRPPDVVLAHHMIAQPCAVRRAAEDLPYVVTPHGSELNFSIRRDARLADYAREGLDGARAIVALSEPSAAEAVGWARENGLDVAGKTSVLPPGVDAHEFAPSAGRAEAVRALEGELALPQELDLRPEHDILAFAGRLLWTKGVQHVVAALPLIARHRPNARLLVAGDGTALAPLRRLASLLDAGDAAAARALAETDEALRTPLEYGPVVDAEAPQPGSCRVAFLGHLPKRSLARVFRVADVAMAPSVFPEAFGHVNVEALSAGSLPVACYHSGTAPLVEIVCGALDDPSFRDLRPGRDLTRGLAGLAVHALERFPTRDAAFRARLHDLATAHYPPWEQVARRYLELAEAARP